MSIDLGPGITVIRGANGHGKTNLVEAVAFSATLRSFRGAHNDALIAGFSHTAASTTADATPDDGAVIRARWRRDDREVLVEVELPRSGRQRVLVNRQRLDRRSALLEQLPISVFGPDDLDMVKGGPGQRRALLDEVLVAMDPRLEPLAPTVEKVLRQRNALLKQMKGRRTAEALVTLDVWDERLAEAGTALARARIAAMESLVDVVAVAYDHLAGRHSHVSLRYDAPWLHVPGGLEPALGAARDDDIRRGVSTVGPHRDEMLIEIDGLPARTHASQGEQRCAALALRLAAHQLVAERRGVTPVLLLDDVFSELDPDRAAALFGALPPGQVLLTTAGIVPEAASDADTVIITREGAVESSRALRAPPNQRGGSGAAG